MKEKKYLHILVTRNNGTEFKNHLKLSEAHFVSQLAQAHKKVVVFLAICTPDTYRYLFG